MLNLWHRNEVSSSQCVNGRSSVSLDFNVKIINHLLHFNGKKLGKCDYTYHVLVFTQGKWRCGYVDEPYIWCSVNNIEYQWQFILSDAEAWIFYGNMKSATYTLMQQLFVSSASKITFAGTWAINSICFMAHENSKWCKGLTLNVQGPIYIGFTRSISWLLMPWLITSPWHQQPWYWLCRIDRFLSYLRKDFNSLRRINVKKWHKMY